MQNKKNKLATGKLKSKSMLIALVLLISTFSLSNATAQESVNASGGNATGSGGSATYSIGQVVYTTNTGMIGSVAQGVQQAYEISVVTEIKEAKGINLSIAAFPNPTTDYLTLSISDNIQTSYDLYLLSYQLYDMNGKLLKTQKITDSQTSIVMTNLVPATYFVKVMESNKELKTFKISKN